MSDTTTTTTDVKISIEVKGGAVNLQWEGVTNPLEVVGWLELAKGEALSYLYEASEEKPNGHEN
jgi:hypothetical protein